VPLIAADPVLNTFRVEANERDFFFSLHRDVDGIASAIKRCDLPLFPRCLRQWVAEQSIPV
jgi:hypothetical protein